MSEEIVRATSAIDEALAVDPKSAGESRSGRTQLLIETPLWVEFEVHDETPPLVIVTSVRYRPASND
jgi:hypothetical protein